MKREAWLTVEATCRVSIHVAPGNDVLLAPCSPIELAGTPEEVEDFLRRHQRLIEIGALAVVDRRVRYSTT